MPALLIELALGQSRAGLTLRAQLVDTAGASVGGLVSSGFTEFGQGSYQWYYTGYSDAFAAAGGSVVFTESGSPTVPLGSAGVNPADFGIASSTSVEALAAAVWAYDPRTLTSSAAQTAADVEGDDLALRRGDTWDESFTGLGSLVGRTKLWFTAKISEQDLDPDAIIQIEEGAGLLYLNGAAPLSASDGSITVTDATTGALTIHLEEAHTAELVPATGLFYDIQQRTGTDHTRTIVSGRLVIERDVTRVTS